MLDGRAKKLFITIAPERTSQYTSLCTEGREDSEGVGRLEGLTAKHPVVSGGSVNKDECIAEAPHSYTITKGNVNVNYVVEIAVLGTIDGASVIGLGYSSIRSQGGRKLPRVNPDTVLTL